MIKRVIWIILDSVGIGALPDADQFGDSNEVNTLGNISRIAGEIKMPNLTKLGIGNIYGAKNLKKVEETMGNYGKAAELSKGKDTTTGHWEMTGIISEHGFPVFPEGFPKEIIEKFISENKLSGVLGNKPASGTEIIKELGEEHGKTGKPIVYTSADSVFQIACNEEIYPVEKLYEMCRSARKILTGKNGVARVIARPFIRTADEEGNTVYKRTSGRRDFSLKPETPNLLTNLTDAGISTFAVGKIEDIFAGTGITEAVHTKDNQDGMDKTVEYMKNKKEGLIFTNLVEFDSTWGHRRDPAGYKKGIEEFDVRLGQVLDLMDESDMLVINADHGCDPTAEGTDHTREYVPVLVYGKKLKSNTDLKIRSTFADIGQTIAEALGCSPIKVGTSFYKEII